MKNWTSRATFWILVLFHGILGQNSIFFQETLEKMLSDGLQNCPRAVLEARGQHLFPKSREKGRFTGFAGFPSFKHRAIYYTAQEALSRVKTLCKISTTRNWLSRNSPGRGSLKAAKKFSLSFQFTTRFMQFSGIFQKLCKILLRVSLWLLCILYWEME